MNTKLSIERLTTALGEHFGLLDAHPNLENPFTQHPQVFELAASHGGVADEWHSDISFSSEPAMMSILNMIECPAVGGDTMWANTAAAYDALSAPPRFCVRYRWQKGTIAVWDNRCTQHFVVGDFDEQRIIQRVTVMGDKPESEEAPRWEPYTRQQVVGATSRYDQQLNEALGREALTLESNRKPGAGD